MRRLLYLMGFCMIAGCSNEGVTGLSSPIPISAPYRFDMKIKESGRDHIGVVALEKKSRHKFKFKWKHSAELIKVTTCHREVVVESAGLFRGKKEYEWDYRPTGIESTGFCPVYVAAYDMKGQHAWAYLTFRNSPEREGLAAEVACSGTTKSAIGVSVCQSRAGLVQRIKFKEGVVLTTLPQCAEPEEVRLHTFEIKASSGICQYVFTGTTSRKAHRLEILGYSDILYRQIKAKNQEIEGGFP